MEDVAKDKDDELEIVSSGKSAAIVILQKLHLESMEKYNKASLWFRELVKPSNRLMPLYLHWLEAENLDSLALRSEGSLQKLLKKNFKEKWKCVECYSFFYC